MPKNAKKAVYVPTATHREIARWAKKHGMDLGEAVDRLTHVAFGRLGALEKYNTRTRSKGQREHREAA